VAQSGKTLGLDYKIKSTKKSANRTQEKNKTRLMNQGSNYKTTGNSQMGKPSKHESPINTLQVIFADGGSWIFPHQNGDRDSGF
jgi:hypothetical protein